MSRPVFERVMMRCTRVECRRWVSVGPGESVVCPSCAVDGVISPLEAVDMTAHIQQLPASADSPDDVAKLERSKAPTPEKK